MIQLFKRANDKSQGEVDPKDKSKQKWNAEAVFVKIDNEMVPLSELQRVAKDNDYVPVQSVENEIEIDGAVHNVLDLVKKYQAKKNAEDNGDEGDEALQTAKKGMKKFAKKNEEKEEEKEEKENEVAGAKEDNEDEALKKAKANESEGQKDEGDEKGGDDELTVKKGAKKNEDKEEEEEKKENEDKEDEEVKEQIKKNSKDVKHFLRLNNAREIGDANGGTTLTIDTMYSRVDRGREKYGSGK